MKVPSLVEMPVSVRSRRSPFWSKSHAAGGHNYIVYNHMLLAADIDSPEEDYRHLKRAVQLWDVGCERQIELSGPDAARLVQTSTPRNIAKMADDQCFYIPTVDSNGCMTNDPVLLKVAPDRYWVSIADSDLIFFYHGVAAAMNMDVTVREANVSPLGIQGPKAQVLATRMWGEKVSSLGFFRTMRVDVNGSKMILARSGYSMQGGYELYFEGETGGGELWDQLMEKGVDLDVRAGSPCQSERIESGLLSYLSDITHEMTPFEAGLGHFCDMQQDAGCLAWSALKLKQDPVRRIRPIEISGEQLPPLQSYWNVTDETGTSVGRISSACRAWSYDCNAAIGLINKSHWDANTALVVHTPDGARDAVVKPNFWGRPNRAEL